MSIADGPVSSNGRLHTDGLPERRLLAHHLEDLRRSGLTDETISAAAIYSEADPAAIAALLNRRTFSRRSTPVIVFPYSGDGGTRYYRVKPDEPRSRNGEVIKYESPCGIPNQIYIPPGTLQAIRDTTAPLLITEGEKKALAADQAGFPTIGLVGVYGWSTRRRASRLLASLDRIGWRGRDVYIVYDSDYARNEDVRSAAAGLAARLQQREARVRVIQLPDGPPGPDGQPTKQGLDDYLVAQGPDALRRLLTEGEVAVPLSVIRCPASELDPAPTIDTYLSTMQLGGASILRYWRGAFQEWRGGAYSEQADAEIRAGLVNYLAEIATNIRTSVVGNHVELLRARTILPGGIEPPSWIGDHPNACWQPKDILVCRNGLVHLPTLTGVGTNYQCPLTPQFFATSALDYDFVIDAPEPRRWLDFLQQLWPDDLASIRLLQEIFGYLLTPDTSQQKIFMIIGPRRSGKGTIGRVLSALIGRENVKGPTLSSLASNFGLWPMIGKSLAIVSDARLGGGSMTVLERLLAISGEDTVTIDRKYLIPWTGRLPVRFLMLSNELPRFSDPSGAFAGRMVILRLIHSFFGREDRDLTARLLEELPGILHWSVAGWARLRERGYFVVAPSGAELQQRLHELTSPVAIFVREECELGVNFEVGHEELYHAYQTWNNRRRSRSLEPEEFGRLLRAAVHEIGDQQIGDRQRGSRCARRWQYTGIRLAHATEADT